MTKGIIKITVWQCAQPEDPRIVWKPEFLALFGGGLYLFFKTRDILEVVCHFLPLCYDPGIPWSSPIQILAKTDHA